MIVYTAMVMTIDYPGFLLPMPEFFRDPAWRREILNDAFGRGFWIFMAMALIAGAVCFWFRGGEIALQVFLRNLSNFVSFLPRVIIALSIAAMIWSLLPRERIASLVGRESGFAGLAIAMVAGAVTPGGPSSAFALLAVLAAAGADRGALITYITAWATLGFQRVLVWDVPFMGAEFVFFRVFISLPLPVLAGLIARQIPVELALKPETPSGDARQ